MRERLTVEEASRCVLGAARVLEAEMVSYAEAQGRVLARAVVSALMLPPADCSAMDGYAVRAADLANASRESPVRLPVVAHVAAGAQPTKLLQPGESARIFTGAPVPPGANAVIRQEDTEQEGELVRIYRRPALRENIRDAGEDLRPGEVVLEAGTPIGPAEIGVLASLCRSVVAVHRRPRVAILSGGDELVEVDGDIAGGRIVASNAYALSALCRELGAEPIALGISEDRVESVEAQFRAALSADVIVSSAGVSVGDHDHVRPVLEKLGCRLEFWGVKMKPGFPLAFGRFEAQAGGAPGPLVFGLPGNPVSAFVTFEQFVRPLLRTMLGHRQCFRPTLRARLRGRLDKAPGRLHFVRVSLESRNGVVYAASTGSQSSGVMSSLARADGLLIFPQDATELQDGDEVVVQVLKDGFFAANEPGF